jgi:hypothetical protein
MSQNRLKYLSTGENNNRTEQNYGEGTTMIWLSLFVVKYHAPM